MGNPGFNISTKSNQIDLRKLAEISARIVRSLAFTFPGRQEWQRSTSVSGLTERC